MYKCGKGLLFRHTTVDSSTTILKVGINVSVCLHIVFVCSLLPLFMAIKENSTHILLEKRPTVRQICSHK